MYVPPLGTLSSCVLLTLFIYRYDFQFDMHSDPDPFITVSVR